MAEVLQKTDTQLILERPPIFDDIRIGSSICVSGVCLSIVQFDDESIVFDVVQETWKRSKLGSLEKGSSVNLERALLANGRFEGHIVQGHVEGVGVVKRTEDKGQRMQIELSDELIKNCVHKGSITLDGVSLTIAEIDAESVTVALIPHTLENSTLGGLKEGDSVNIETDVLGRYVRKKIK